MGAVIEKLGPRRSEMIEMKNPGQGMVRMMFRIPARGLFGYRSEFLTDTRGTGIMHHRFLDYGPWAGPLAGRKRGVLVADREGDGGGVCAGQPAGAGADVRGAGRPGVRGDDRGREQPARRPRRQRHEGKEARRTCGPRPRTTTSSWSRRGTITLEYGLEYIEEDELIEVTPKTIRLRKRALSAIDRKRASRASRVADAS